ncbi:MAG: cytochrome c biogenesis protein CcsA [Gemmatimonadota bacterium]
MFHFTALFLYALALTLWIRGLLTGARGRGQAVAPWIAVAAVLSHLSALTLFALEYRQLPLVGLGPALSSLALVLGLGLVATLSLREATRIGIVVVPLILVLQTVALVTGVDPTREPLDFQGIWFALHVTFAFLGYQGLALAFAAGLLYLVQFHELKSKRLGRVFRFIPPLATLDGLGRVSLWIGFGGLSIAIVLGWAWTLRYRGTFQVADPKTLWAVVSWTAVVVALLARRGGDRPGRTGALAAVLGFGVVVLFFLVLRLMAVENGLFL